MWFLEVTPLFPLSREVRLWKAQPWELFFFSIYKCIQLEVKTGSIPSLNIQMSGFMIMWLSKDEDNPYSQVKKKGTVQP